MGRPPEIWAYNLLRTKYFHGVSSGSQHPYLLKSRYGKASLLFPSLFKGSEDFVPLIREAINAASVAQYPLSAPPVPAHGFSFPRSRRIAMKTSGVRIVISSY